MTAKQTIDYEELATALMSGMARTKTPSGSPSSIYAHGPGGLLSPAGLSRGLANAMILPSLGVMSLLPKRPNVDSNPLHGIFTGVTATTGDEPESRCDDPPTAGASKLCTHTFVFGWMGRQSRELRLDRIGKMTNRGEFSDFTVVGSPFDGPQVPSGVSAGGGAITPQLINTEVGKLNFELAVAHLRDMATDLYIGNPANNVGGDEGGRTFYNGFDILINTGYVDAITNVACPAADSIVRDFNSVDIASNSQNTVAEITAIYRNLRYIASKAGLLPTKWVISMRWGLFYELTEIWPCAYNTYRCQNLPAGSTNFLDSATQNTMRDEMRGDISAQTGQWLLIDGERVQVVIDDAITETESPAGVFTSDMYFIPLWVKGNNSAPLSEGGGLVSYMEYFPFNGVNGPMAAAQQLAPQGAYEATSNGQFLFHRYYPKNLCVQIACWTQPRLILETPYLAARLQNLSYQPLIHEREPFTTDGYFVDGGNTNFLGFGPSFWGPTS